MTDLRFHGICGLPEIVPGMDIGVMILNRLNESFLKDGDILVVASKIISKVENCFRRRDSIHPTEKALQLAELVGREPEYIQLVLEHSRRIVQLGKGVLITQTHHGFVLANAGVDSSNTGRVQEYLTLPPDPDCSAERLRERLWELSHKKIGIIISDTFGRAWRQGQTDVAIGCSGLNAFIDYRGKADRGGMELKHSRLCCADALAGAAGLLMGKSDGIPVVHVRGFTPVGDGNGAGIPYPEEQDMFLKPDTQEH